jgi:hypothetical protein
LGSRSNAPPSPDARAACTIACTLPSGRPKRVAQQPEGHLARAHDGQSDALMATQCTDQSAFRRETISL